MKKVLSMMLPAIFSLLMFSTTASTTAVSPVDIGTITLEKIDYQNKDYAWYVARLPVGNLSEMSGTVSVRLKSIDKHAYERAHLRMSGHLKAGEQGTLTLLSYMDYKMFDDIRRWEIASIEIH